MLQRFILLACAHLLLAAGLAAEVEQGEQLPESGPWTDAWPMPLRGEDRIFVVHQGQDYLWGRKSDFDKPKLLDGTELALQARFLRRVEGDPRFYGIESVQCTSDDPLLAAAVDGDNFFLFGRVTLQDGTLHYAIRATAQAPSDSDIIGQRLAGLDADNYVERLAVADWAQSKAAEEGNRTFWVEAAQAIRSQTIESAAAAGAEQQNAGLLLQAMNWAIDLMGRRDLAADLASRDWVFALPDDQLQRISDRMARLDYVLFVDGSGNKQWMTEGQFLTKTYEQRYQAIRWGDADGFFQLGLWTEEHGDVLPRATQLAHKAFQIGHRMDPRHNGIRRMLKMPLVEGGSDGHSRRDDQTNRPFVSADQLVTLPEPVGWTRNQPPVISDADASWTNHQLSTTYLAISSRQFVNPAAPDAHWQDLMGMLQALPDAQLGKPWRSDDGDRTTLQTNFTFTANDNERKGRIALVHDGDLRRSAALRVVYEVSNETPSLQAFDNLLPRLSFTAPATPTPNDDIGAQP